MKRDFTIFTMWNYMKTKNLNIRHYKKYIGGKIDEEWYIVDDVGRTLKLTPEQFREDYINEINI